MKLVIHQLIIGLRARTRTSTNQISLEAELEPWLIRLGSLGVVRRQHGIDFEKVRSRGKPFKVNQTYLEPNSRKLYSSK